GRNAERLQGEPPRQLPP
ncbi:hypothetical protein BN1708_020611, partial [Verticillium longisporum]